MNDCFPEFAMSATGRERMFDELETGRSVVLEIVRPVSAGLPAFDWRRLAGRSCRGQVVGRTGRSQRQLRRRMWKWGAVVR